MTQEQWIIFLFRIACVSIELTVIAFIVIYTLLAPWWRNVLGRSIVTIDALLGMAFIPSVLSLFFDFNRLTSRIAAWADIVVFFAIAGVMLWRCWIWIRIHRKKKGLLEETDGYRRT